MSPAAPPSPAPEPHRHRSGQRLFGQRLFGSWFVLLALMVVLLPAFGFWWWQGYPVPVVDAPQPRVPCLSYAPYQGTQTPFDETLVIPPEQIDRDLEKLAGFTSCIRTYSVHQGLEAVPRLAEKHGLKVMLGAWIGRDTKRNDTELAKAIDIANRYPQTVASVVVGNEVLLRREQPAEALSAMIRRVRSAVPMPVTYADVWEFWEQNPTVADAVDFITIHTLPYWEDDPRPIERAVPHVVAVWRAMAIRFAGKSVFIGEAGWPSAGRMREGALPNPLNQARFVRELMVAAERENIGLNLIEAFDQPWKRALEGTVGGHWGLFDDARQQKFALTGPVSNDPGWLAHFAATAGVSLLLLLPALIARKRRLSAGRWLGCALSAVIAALLLVLGVNDGVDASRTVYDWAVLAVRCGVGVAAALLLLDALGAPSSAAPPLPILALIRAVRQRQGPSVPWRTTAWGLVSGLTLFGAAATTLCLVFDPRYRDFATTLYAVPALALALLAVTLPRPSAARGAGTDEPDDRREETLLAVVLAVGGVAVAINEGFANHQALGWTGVCLLLAAGVWLWPRRPAGQAGSRTRASAPSKKPAAAGSGT